MTTSAEIETYLGLILLAGVGMRDHHEGTLAVIHLWSVEQGGSMLEQQWYEIASR